MFPYVDRIEQMLTFLNELLVILLLTWLYTSSVVLYLLNILILEYNLELRFPIN